MAKAIGAFFKLRYILHFIIIILKDKKFFYVGNLVAMGLVQGGSGIPFLAPPVYNYLCGMSMQAVKVSLEDAPNFEVQELVEKVHVRC